MRFILIIYSIIFTTINCEAIKSTNQNPYKTNPIFYYSIIDNKYSRTTESNKYTQREPDKYIQLQPDAHIIVQENKIFLIYENTEAGITKIQTLLQEQSTFHTIIDMEKVKLFFEAPVLDICDRDFLDKTANRQILCIKYGLDSMPQCICIDQVYVCKKIEFFSVTPNGNRELIVIVADRKNI